MKTMQSKKFAFFGTPYVARDTLAHLLEQGFSPEVVVTSPDAPRGRGMVMTPCETKAFALEKGLTVLSPEKLDDAAVASIATHKCDYAVVVAYGKMFPETLIAAFPLGAINVHYSLLPKYRGASPVESALLNGDETTGVAIQKLVKEMDAGDILALLETAIEPTDTTATLRPRLVTLGAQMLVELLPKFEKGEITAVPQDTTQATRARKIAKSDGELDLAGDQAINWRKYRAFAEGPGTYFFKDGKRVKIKTASFINNTFTPLRVVPEGKNETDYKNL